MNVSIHCHYTLYTNTGVSAEQILAAIRTTIGLEAQTTYFPHSKVVQTQHDENNVAIHFDHIPVNDDLNLIEAVMLALAPFIRPGQEIALLVGGILSRTYLYQFRDSEVFSTPAHLEPDHKGHHWMPVKKETP